MWLDVWKFGTHRMICSACHHHAITRLRQYQLFQRRSSGKHWLGGHILSAFEPDVLQGIRRRDPRCWVPVQTPRHKVYQMHVVTVVKSRVKWPRWWNAANFASSRFTGCQLAHTTDTGTSTVSTAIKQAVMSILVLKDFFPGPEGLHKD